MLCTWLLIRSRNSGYPRMLQSPPPGMLRLGAACSSRVAPVRVSGSVCRASRERCLGSVPRLQILRSLAPTLCHHKPPQPSSTAARRRDHIRALRRDAERVTAHRDDSLPGFPSLSASLSGNRAPAACYGSYSRENPPGRRVRNRCLGQGRSE